MLRSLDGVFAALLLAALVGGAVLLDRPERLAGAVRVIDGDTLDLGGRHIRLVGIDAPEIDQTCGDAGRGTPCGRTARDALRSLVAAGEVACDVIGRDKWRRDLAACEAGGRDLGAALVRAGQAVASGRYRPEEREARALGIGIWAAPFDLPSRWRSAHRG